MKRFFWLVLILLLFLTACGSKEAMTERCTISISCAMGIGLQFKNGRFDFSGGAIMLLSAIIAGR